MKMTNTCMDKTSFVLSYDVNLSKTHLRMKMQRLQHALRENHLCLRVSGGKIQKWRVCSKNFFFLQQLCEAFIARFPLI